MPRNQVGFTSVNRQVTSGANSQSDIVSSIAQLKNKIVAGRVIDIILDENHPAFEVNGGWTSIGKLFFEKVEGDANVKNAEKSIIASPLFPNMKNVPVVNEIVLLIQLPNQDILNNSNSVSYYYFNPISIWNHPNLNAYPNILNQDETQPSENKTYQEIEAGQVRRSTDEEIEYEYNSPAIGGTFVASDKIQPLIPFAGDYIIEGRFGNSIRFGSTISGSTSNYTSSLLSNNWSAAGASGEPITLLRNGQAVNKNNSWTPTVENINFDKSSIYLTSNQLIPIASNFTSFPAIKSKTITTLQSYSGSQVILNSNRLVFNANNDSIIVNSNENVSINSINDIGLFSRRGEITFQGQKINLGDANASQSLIFGDSFIFDFKNLIMKIQTLCDNLALEPKLVATQGSANNVAAQIQLMLNKISDYTSKTTRTT